MRILALLLFFAAVANAQEVWSFLALGTAFVQAGNN